MAVALIIKANKYYMFILLKLNNFSNSIHILCLENLFSKMVRFAYIIIIFLLDYFIIVKKGLFISIFKNFKKYLSNRFVEILFLSTLFPF